MIEGDDDLTAENGVVGGDGSQGDPYRIEGWLILAPVGSAIWIQNTTKHVSIAYNDLIGAVFGDPFSAGIRLSHASNITIRNNQLSENSVGVHCFVCDNLTIIGNQVGGTPNPLFGGLTAAIDGIHLRQSTNVLIQSNVVEGVAWGILVEDHSARIDIVGNDVRDITLGQAIAVYRNSTDAKIEGNFIERGGEAINVRGASNVLILDNEVVDSPWGITWDQYNAFGETYSTNGLWILNNTVRSSGHGLAGWASTDVHVLSNTFEGNEIGAEIHHAMEMRHNFFRENDVAIEVWSAEPGEYRNNSIISDEGIAVAAWYDNDLSLNWWGSNTGPSWEDIVLHNGAELQVEPWLEEPPLAV